ncbi:G-type lectin S-receptor-like serine/threonine-protein kinase [Camellia lanceoleosa]|uniref:G-type lectin S-receptor-like serine/threonine-protein kinase n=1 Tax=Camellia lanceoleosa TaxID=1840588 RepID=A0ACC0H8M0_9ERIC|nr:G-type lectin S-receptor-like serine/threonine-protein kinase [Camellia lanceoleosa]
MMDELAMVVRPEVGSDEVAMENGVNEDVELESDTVGSNVDIPVPEESYPYSAKFRRMPLQFTEDLDILFLDAAAIGEWAYTPSSGVMPHTDETMEEFHTPHDADLKVVHPSELNKKRPSNTDGSSTKSKRKKKFTGATLLTKTLDRIVNVVESSSATSTQTSLRYPSIAKCLAKLESIPGVSPNDELFVLDVTGQLKQFVWGKDFPQWSTFWIKPPQQCTVYAFCGVFSSCNQNVPICTCIEGFEPRTQADWELGDHSGGCVRKIPLQCENRGNDKFSVVPNTGFPVNSELITVENIDECELACLRNCSCGAYAYDNRCLIWGGGLFNLRQLSSDDKSGRDLHVSVAASQLVGTKAKAKAKRNTSLIVFGAICGFFCFFGSVLVVLWRKRQRDPAGTLEKVDDSLAVFKTIYCIHSMS